MADNSEEAGLRASVDVVGQPWETSAYYDSAEKWTFVFWDQSSLFRPLFEQLDLTSTIELACGHGRHAQQIVDQTGQLTLMDIFESNLNECRQRLAGKPNVSFIRGDGYTFRPIPKSSITSIFCYDAMVHFSPDLVQSYLNDAHRVLRPGGMILLHHSNYSAPMDRHYGQNPHARNHMTKELFRSYVTKAGLAVKESIVIPWGNVPDLDCVTLCQR